MRRPDFQRMEIVDQTSEDDLVELHKEAGVDSCSLHVCGWFNEK